MMAAHSQVASVLSTLVAISALVSASGCTDTPGALEMQLIPHPRVIAADEPIEFDITLRATKDGVCLWKKRALDIHVVGPDRDGFAGVGGRFGAGSSVLCGNEVLAKLPLAPLGYLDIADAADRFTVLKSGEIQRVHVTIWPSAHVAKVWCEEGLASLSGRPTKGTWDEGEYTCTVQLVNRGGVLPAPFFWRPYDPPLSATATVETVADQAQSGK